MKKEINYQLYLVTEESMPMDLLKEKIEKAVRGGVSLVQLREKETDSKTYFEKAIQLKQYLDSLSVPLIINDRLDIALAVEAAGIHVGQKDLPVWAIKKILPASMVVGVSARNVEEAVQAEKDGADYIGVGSVFPTKSKEDAKLLPKGMLDRILEAVSIPVVAIGGINEENSKELRKYKINGAAVVSSLTKAEDPETAARILIKNIYG